MELIPYLHKNVILEFFNGAVSGTNTDYASVIVLPLAIGIIGLIGCYIGIIPETVGLIYF